MAGREASRGANAGKMLHVTSQVRGLVKRCQHTCEKGLNGDNDYSCSQGCQHMDFSPPAGGNIKCYSHFGNEFGGVLTF